MKTSLTLLVALTLHILATSAHRSTPNLIRLPTSDEGAGAVAADDSPILDVDGDVLWDHVEYYMLPFTLPGSDAGGGGVKLARLDPANECWTDAIQTPDSSDPGTPVVFFADAYDSGIKAVLDPSVYQSVGFDNMTTPCLYSLSWKIKYDDRSKKHFVKVGEAEGDQSYVFKVKRFRPNVNAYKIVYCPLDEEDICYNVGRFYDEESKNIRLALSDEPFVCVFKKSHA